ncbi:hypothetical protein ACH5RR_029573 [Cinchona calisaya]|uniref:RNase H type-1 domain-containing protein n=1 Tax=Cinchona calisaya TaxID=153742 RepID=A0ABD2YVC4_9GENT
MDMNGKLLKVWVDSKRGTAAPSLIEAEATRTALIIARSQERDRVRIILSNKTIVLKIFNGNPKNVKLAQKTSYLRTNSNIKAIKLTYFAVNMDNTRETESSHENLALLSFPCFESLMAFSSRTIEFEVASRGIKLSRKDFVQFDSSKLVPGGIGRKGDPVGIGCEGFQ